jgi:hypothetical protein
VTSSNLSVAVAGDGTILKDRTGLLYRARDLARVERLAAADVVDGTVCRWKSTTERGTEYLYVALYVAGHWWITGVADFYGERKFTTYDFVTRVLAKGSQIAVVTSWEEVR